MTQIIIIPITMKIMQTMIRDLNDNEDKNIGGNENDDDNVNLFTTTTWITMTIDMTITGQLRRTKL